jgi:hypothetical protein
MDKGQEARIHRCEENVGAPPNVINHDRRNHDDDEV